MPLLSFASYGQILRRPALRSALILGFALRLPVFSSGVLLTVHVVTTLRHTYAAAGVLSAAATIAIAVSGPWRGKLLDQIGLRRVVLPSTAVAAVCWSIAPWVGYWPLFVLAVIAGLFVIPSISIVRQAIMAAVPEKDRRTAISLDAAALELSFMIGPALTIWAAAVWDTRWVLFATQMLGVAGGVAVWLANPPLRAEGEDQPGEGKLARRVWFRLPFLAVCAAGAATTIVLAGTDIGVVAAVRDFGSPAQIGVVLALWGAGSLLGGLLYGALHRPISAFWLLLALGVVTLPMALATNVATLSALAFLAGLLCAPTITATIDQASRLVPARARGEAMGWHGSFLTAGGAMGAPVAGVAIDHWDFRGGFVVTALVGVLIAVVGSAAAASRRRLVAR